MRTIGEKLDTLLEIQTNMYLAMKDDPTDFDQVTCDGCGCSVYKDDCARTTTGGWLCESCQEKYEEL